MNNHSSGADSPQAWQTLPRRWIEPMPDCPNALLIDLPAAQDIAAGFGRGLEPRLLELLIDRHAGRAGTHRLAPPIRKDGPAQQVPACWPHIGVQCSRTAGAAHARRWTPLPVLEPGREARQSRPAPGTPL